MLALFRKKPKGIFLGYGWKLDEPLGKARRVIWKEEYRKGHFFCFGTTRVGKTRLMELMIEQDIRDGKSVFVIDPKGDVELFSKIVQVAFETGRQNELILVTPIYPQYSAKIDPLSHYYMPEEVVSHVVAGIKAREEFFVNIAYETTLVIVLSQVLFAKVEGREAFFNFAGIKKYAYYGGLQELKKALESLRKVRKDLREEVAEVETSLDQVLSSPPDYFAKVSSSLRTVLTALSTGSVGAVIGKAESNEFIKRLERGERVITVVQTGSMLTRRTAFILARVLLSMVQSFVGRVFASGRKVEPPLCVYVDEASDVLYLGVENLFNKAGGANVWIHAFTQSIADLETEIGESAARKILDNTNTKVFMRVNDNRTAEYIAEYAGKVKGFSPIFGTGGNITVRQTEDYVIRPEHVTNLAVREFYMFTYEKEAYRGKIARVAPATVEVEYPDIRVGENADA